MLKVPMCGHQKLSSLSVGLFNCARGVEFPQADNWNHGVFATVVGFPVSGPDLFSQSKRRASIMDRY
uniref:Uncharacterized protein n=1 Tax=Trichuris muris TaxID=70415 RepID=A0A5S6QRK2_TRIMR